MKGYLAVLDSLVDELEPPEVRASALRGLVAPRLPVVPFREALARAESARSSCLASLEITEAAKLLD